MYVNPATALTLRSVIKANAVPALQAQAKAPKLRDWEELVEACLKKAAMTHAPSRLLAMHSAVPNASSRMVFQSRRPSLQPDTDLGLGLSSDSSLGSLDSSPGSNSLLQQQASAQAGAAGIQRLLSKVLDLPQTSTPAGSDLAVGKSHGKSGKAVATAAMAARAVALEVQACQDRLRLFSVLTPSACLTRLLLC